MFVYTILLLILSCTRYSFVHTYVLYVYIGEASGHYQCFGDSEM